MYLNIQPCPCPSYQEESYAVSYTDISDFVFSFPYRNVVQKEMQKHAGLNMETIIVTEQMIQVNKNMRIIAPFPWCSGYHIRTRKVLSSILSGNRFFFFFTVS